MRQVKSLINPYYTNGQGEARGHSFQVLEVTTEHVACVTKHFLSSSCILYSEGMRMKKIGRHFQNSLRDKENQKSQNVNPETENYKPKT